MVGMGMHKIQEMQPSERADWLREMAGIRLEYVTHAAYPIDILRNGNRIGGVVRSGRRIVMELRGIGEFGREKAFNMDALEIWECEWPQDVSGDDDAKRINEHIYYFLGEWAQQNPPKD